MVITKYKKKGLCRKCNHREIKKYSINHSKHLGLTVLTFGIWGGVWAYTYYRRCRWQCNRCGSHNVVHQAISRSTSTQ